jgi:hypothetical protein
MADFIEIVNRIFINKKMYKEISEEDKINAFFIINRKFGKQFPEMSRKFNHKNIDKASAIDMWFNFFKNERKIPEWYWDPKNRDKKTKISKKSNYEAIKFREDLDDVDMNYLEKYYEDDLKLEMKKINKFEQ